ncbi:hypothetical protein MOV61_04840 [Neorhizobium sp. BETTINA12A]|nr:hypothetical protein [Neorhizobium sp. BETTINA12A]
MSEAFAPHVINDIEEPSAAGELVVDEIERPAGIGLRLDQDRCRRAEKTPPLVGEVAQLRWQIDVSGAHCILFAHRIG